MIYKRNKIYLALHENRYCCRDNAMRRQTTALLTSHSMKITTATATSPSQDSATHGQALALHENHYGYRDSPIANHNRHNALQPGLREAAA